MFLEAEDAKIYYEIYGEGEPLVCLSGLGGGISLWYPVIRNIRDKYKVILYDHRGVGKSTAAENTRFSMRLLADDLCFLLDSLELKRVNVVGYSMGGWVAQRFAVEYPNRVRSLVLVSSSYKIYKKEETILRYFQEVLRYNNEETLAKVLLLTYYSEYFFERNAEVLDKIIFRSGVLLKAQSSKVLIDVLDACVKHSIASEISTLTMPIFIISGEHDFLCPRYTVKDFKKQLPFARWVELKEVGHATLMEKSDDLSRLLLDFLSSLKKSVVN